jgi:hypothetical protein
MMKRWKDMQIKRVLAVLFVVLFVVTVTTGAVSANVNTPIHPAESIFRGVNNGNANDNPAIVDGLLNGNRNFG